MTSRSRQAVASQDEQTKMHANLSISGSTLLLFVLLSLPITAMATDEACTAVTQKCTKDKPYEKTIDGSIYSCYDCKQALCKDGENGGISGTATTSICTEKATTFQSITLDDQARGGDTLAPKPTTSRRPGKAVAARLGEPAIESIPPSERAPIVSPDSRVAIPTAGLLPPLCSRRTAQAC